MKQYNKWLLLPLLTILFIACSQDESMVDNKISEELPAVVKFSIGASSVDADTKAGGNSFVPKDHYVRITLEVYEASDEEQAYKVGHYVNYSAKATSNIIPLSSIELEFSEVRIPKVSKTYTAVCWVDFVKNTIDDLYYNATDLTKVKQLTTPIDFTSTTDHTVLDGYAGRQNFYVGKDDKLFKKENNELFTVLTARRPLSVIELTNVRLKEKDDNDDTESAYGITNYGSAGTSYNPKTPVPTIYNALTHATVLDTKDSNTFRLKSIGTFAPTVSPFSYTLYDYVFVGGTSLSLDLYVNASNKFFYRKTDHKFLPISLSKDNSKVTIKAVNAEDGTNTSLKFIYNPI